MKQMIYIFIIIFFATWGNTATNTVLKLDFEQYTPVGHSIQGGIIQQIPPKNALVTDKKRQSVYLAFNGRDDILEIALSPGAENIFKKSFTLEFDFFSRILPIDDDFHNPGQHDIQILAGLNNKQESMGFYENRYNRFTINWRNLNKKIFSIQSTWDHKNNYELAGILRGKWYHIALVYDKNRSIINLYLDGEKLGSTPIQGDLQPITSIRFGGNPVNGIKNMFCGGIDNIKLTASILYNEKTDAIAEKTAWQRLHDKANDRFAEYLLPENPDWSAHHPRMLLTPARIAILKNTLQKGKGPELVKQLIARCDEMINPESPYYLKKMTTGHDINFVMRPAELCLATILTGNDKYAKHAANIVTKYAGTVGYYDVSQQLVASAGLSKPLMAAALTYDWGYKYFTTSQRQVMRLFFLNIAKGTYDFYTDSITSTAHGDALSGWAANWTALSIATLGNVSLSILGETSAEVPLWLDYAKFRSAQYGLFAIGTNGCFHEMPGYLAYGAGPIIMFMEALYTAGGDDLIKITNFSKVTEWLPYLFYPDSIKLMPLKYSAEINGLHAGDSYIMALLRKKIHSPNAEWCWQHLYANKPWAENWSMFPLIWFEPETNKLQSPDLPLAKWFKSDGVVAFRSDWTKDAVAGIFMAYPAIMVTHDQCDRGQFTLYGYQGRWIIDNGGRQQPEYAWRDAHNLITVDNNVPIQKARLMHNYHHDAFITGFCTDDKIMTASEADLTQSYRYTYTWGYKKQGNTGKYGDPFKNANRKIIFMRESSAPPYLIVYDSIQQDNKEHTYTLNLHTSPENEVTINGSIVQFHKYPETEETLSYISHPVNKDGSQRYYYSGSTNAGYAEYKIKIPTAGKYNLFGYGRPGNKVPGGMDSFFISFNGRRINWGTGSYPIYNWSKINTTPFNLKAGEYTLTVLIREPEARVAKFTVYPADKKIPLFNKLNDPELIVIDAGKPYKIKPGFIIGTEKTNKKSPAAEMTLLQLYPESGFTTKAFPGIELPHQRLQSSIKAVRGRFLNLFYPHKPDMQQPILTKINKNNYNVQWQNCVDLICTKEKNIIAYSDIKSDADLVIIRKKQNTVIAFVIINGSYLQINAKTIIELSGGKGIAAWRSSDLAISGENVSNFIFNFPNNVDKSNLLKHTTANGRKIKTILTDKGISASEPFPGQRILSW